MGLNLFWGHSLSHYLLRGLVCSLNLFRGLKSELIMGSCMKSENILDSGWESDFFGVLNFDNIYDYCSQYIFLVVCILTHSSSSISTCEAAQNTSSATPG